MPAEKILLVEDDQSMLALLRTLLRFEGFEVTRLEREEELDEILGFIREQKPALILLDVHLHQLNGFDLLYRIRKDQDIKDTRILMYSGIDFRSRCMAEGADGFILKPFMPEELIRKIRKTLGETKPSLLV